MLRSGTEKESKKQTNKEKVKTFQIFRIIQQSRQTTQQPGILLTPPTSLASVPPSDGFLPRWRANDMLDLPQARDFILLPRRDPSTAAVPDVRNLRCIWLHSCFSATFVFDFVLPIAPGYILASQLPLFQFLFFAQRFSHYYLAIHSRVDYLSFVWMEQR